LISRRFHGQPRHARGFLYTRCASAGTELGGKPCVGQSVTTRPDPGDSWLRLQYVVHDYWSGEACEIDDKIFLATSRPPFGGLRWWFVCPRENRRVRKLHVALGGRHFWSRRAYELAYASQRETKYDRALRRARKLRLRLGGDPADDEYPDKPPRMRWATYNRLMDRLVAADGVADVLAARLLGKIGPVQAGGSAL
jgi:hypothetical protein